MRTLKYIPVLILILVFSFTLSSSQKIEASTPVAGSHTMILYETWSYADIIEENDYFVLVRFELPYVNSSETTTGTFCTSDFLDDDAGCELTPPKPTFPFSLKSGFIEAKLYSCSGNWTVVSSSVITCSGTQQLELDQPKFPQIGMGLVGLYGKPDSKNAYGKFGVGDEPNKLCIEQSSTLFTAPETVCQLIEVKGSGWGANFGGRTALGTSISSLNGGLMSIMENDLGLPQNTLVSKSQLITPLGQTYLVQSLPAVVDVAIDSEGDSVFQLGVQRPNMDFVRKTGEVPLQTHIYATATASGVKQNLDAVGSEYLGLSGLQTGFIFYGFLGLILGGLGALMTKNSLVGIIAFVSPLLAGVFVGAVSIAFLFTGLSILLVLGSWYFIRRSPE